MSEYEPKRYEEAKERKTGEEHRLEGVQSPAEERNLEEVAFHIPRD
jgi:hypothetical protein